MEGCELGAASEPAANVVSHASNRAFKLNPAPDINAPAEARAFAAELQLLRINSRGTGCKLRDEIALPAA